MFRVDTSEHAGLGLLLPSLTGTGHNSYGVAWEVTLESQPERSYPYDPEWNDEAYFSVR